MLDSNFRSFNLTGIRAAAHLIQVPGHVPGPKATLLAMAMPCHLGVTVHIAAKLPASTASPQCLVDKPGKGVYIEKLLRGET